MNNWKQTTKVLWFGESADQTQGALPAIAVNYPIYKGFVGNLILSSSHAVLSRFSSNLIVTLGTFDGLDKATSWLPNNHPCGGVRNTVYPITRYSDNSDLFVGTLCRDLPPEAVCDPAPTPKPGDKVEWWSVARRSWQSNTISNIDSLGRISCHGTQAISQDSGSPVFTPDGKYIGAVSEWIDNGLIAVSFKETTPTPEPTPTPPHPIPTSIPFESLYAEATNAQDRITLLTLAKLYHIRNQNFHEALTYQDLEKTLKDALNNLGKEVIEKQ